MLNDVCGFDECLLSPHIRFLQGAAVVGVRARDAVILAVEQRAAAKLQVRGCDFLFPQS